MKTRNDNAIMLPLLLLLLPCGACGKEGDGRAPAPAGKPGASASSGGTSGEPATGRETFALVDCTTPLECQDGIWCNGIEYCGCRGATCRVCMGGQPQVCDDGNPCTVDNCVNDTYGTPGTTGVPGEFGTGHCSHDIICEFCYSVDQCDDRNACTTDSCVANRCRHVPISCDDGLICTVDSCAPGTGCAHAAIPNCCRSNGDCNDGKDCTTDTCNTVTHNCLYAPTPGASCSYPTNPCYNPGTCRDDGLCGPGPLNGPANDLCDGVADIALSTLGEACVQGTTTCASNQATSTCGGAASPDVTYHLTYTTGDAFQLYNQLVTLEADFDAVLIARSGCGDLSQSLGCNDNCTSNDAVDCFHYGLGATDAALLLPPMPVGRGSDVYLFADARGGGSGDFQLKVHKTPLKNNPCIRQEESGRRVDATRGGEYRGNVNAYMNDLIGGGVWTFYRNVTIGGTGAPVDGYQAMITLNASNFNYAHARGDGADLRFFDQYGNQVPHWIEQWNPAGNSFVWVRVPLAGTTTLQMRYGNPFAPSASNGEEVFEFFDGFDGGALDDVAWNVGGFGGYAGVTYTVGGGELTVTCEPGTWCDIQLNKEWLPAETTVLEGRIKGYATNPWIAFSLVYRDAPNSYRFGLYTPNQVTWYAHRTPSSDVSLTSVTPGTYQRVVLKKTATTSMNVSVYNDDRGYLNGYTGSNSNWSGVTWTFNAWVNYASPEQYYDWVFERKYVATEPAVSVGAEGDLYEMSYEKTPCHAWFSRADSDWPGNAWFFLAPTIATTYCISTDEDVVESWVDTVIAVYDNTLPPGCSGVKRYMTCAHLDGRNGGANPTQVEVIVPGGATYMVGVSPFNRPQAGNYSLRFTPGRCGESCAESGGKLYMNSCYKQYTVPKLYPEAQLQCQLWGGHLVTISSLSENTFVKTNFADVTGDNPWIGFNDTSTEGRWVWVTAEPVVWTNWNAGEPNDWGGSEDWGQIISGTGKWNDCGVACGSRSYVCERP